MKMNDAYPSRYLKADVDVPEEGNLVLTISEVNMATFGQGKDSASKPVVSFYETEKQLVLNKTNWKLISTALGTDETAEWDGRAIALYSADVQYGDEMTRGIRVRSKAPAPRRRKLDPADPTNPPPAPKVPVAVEEYGDETDEVPF